MFGALLTAAAVVVIGAGSALAQAPTARDAHPTPGVSKPVQPPKGLEAPADLRNPESTELSGDEKQSPGKDQPSAKRQESMTEPRGEGTTAQPGRVDPAMTQKGHGANVMAKECNECKLIRGKVLAVQENVLIVKTKNQPEIRITMDRETMLGQENTRFGGYMEGDRIEAYVKPDGKAHSISLWRGNPASPGPDDISGG